MKCQQYLCDKGIHTIKNWRDELLRLRKAHKDFERHPDFMKLTQCKDDIISKEQCNAMKPSRPSNAPMSEAMKKYMKKMADLDAKRTQLIQVHDRIQELTASIDYYNEVLKKLTRMIEASLKFIKEWETDESRVSQAKENVETYHKQAKIIRKALDNDMNNLERLKYLYEDIQRKVKVLEKQTREPPSPRPRPPSEPPPSPRPRPPSEPPTKKSGPVKSRCPNGTRRNKSTGKCEKK